MPQVVQSWEEYLARGWQRVVGEFANRPTAVVLMSYHRSLDHRPRIYPTKNPQCKVILACAADTFRLPHDRHWHHQQPALTALVQLLHSSYSAGAADCLDILLGSFLSAAELSQLAICWHFYVGHASLPIEELAVALANVTPHSSLTLLHCLCVPTRRLAAIDQINALIEIPCGGQTQLARLLEVIIASDSAPQPS